MTPPFNLKAWIEEHRHLLKPPVGNAQLFKDAEFIVMIVGGPNVRTDFHVDPAEELFYQLEGDITLKVVEDGKARDIPIREGELFLLPPFVPHSPRRPAKTVGLVVERARRAAETDRLRWYCENPACGEQLYDTQFHMKDITTQLPPIFQRFYADLAARTCRKCGAVSEPPKTPA